MTCEPKHLGDHTIHTGDCVEVLRQLPDGSVNCCVTSPPYYGLRDYGHEGQIGLEESPDAYVAKMVEVFREVRRVLRDDGTLWLNLGDSYSAGKVGRSDKQDGGGLYSGPQAKRIGVQPIQRKGDTKQLLGIPWRVAFALQSDGWVLRQDIIWHKPNPMPESVKDRCTKAHEYVFLFAKQPRYWFDSGAMKEPSVDPESLNGRGKRNADKFTSQPFSETRKGFANIEAGKTYPFRNRRSVWSICPRPYKGAHFAVFPPALIEPCVKAGCPEGGTVLDPFGGSGTTGQVAKSLGRKSVLIELNPAYVPLMEARLAS